MFRAVRTSVDTSTVCGSCGVEVARECPKDVALGEDPGRAIVLDHQRRADVSLAHERRRLGDGGAGFDRDEVLAHDVPDRRHAVEQG